MAGHNRWEVIRRSTPAQDREYRRWAKLVDGATLVQLRALKGKTLGEVGTTLRVSRVQAGRLERGGDELQLSAIRRYLEAIGMELDGLLVRDRERDYTVVTVKLEPFSNPEPARRRRAR